MKIDIKELVRKALMVLAVLTILFSLYKISMIKVEENTSKTVNKEVIEIIGEQKDGEVNFLTQKSFKQLKEINREFKGYLHYPSLKINEQVVQTNNNEYYLNHSFYREYLEYGTVFIDANQDLNSQNTTLYGHWVSNSSLKFSDLHKLKNEKDYDKYKTFYFSDDEFTYEYEVGIVMYHHSVNDYDNIPYWQDSFSEKDFNSFINNAKSLAFYDTGVEFKFSDKIMTLQTCISVDNDERLVVIGKEVGRKPLPVQ